MCKLPLLNQGSILQDNCFLFSFNVLLQKKVTKAFKQMPGVRHSFETATLIYFYMFLYSLKRREGDTEL